MTNIPNTSVLFATIQLSPDTERCYRYQMRNFAECLHEPQGKVDMGKGVVMNTLEVYRR
jgi:hypothetical protein